jgi:hypothetical protein
MFGTATMNGAKPAISYRSLPMTVSQKLRFLKHCRVLLARK